MDSHNVKHAVLSAAAGSVLLLSGNLVLAGDHLIEFEPDRPQISPGCQPNWGFHQTCWRRFPSLPPCNECNVGISEAAYGDSFAPGIYTQQQPYVISGDQPLSAGGSRYLASPMSVLPRDAVSSPASGIPASGIPASPVERSPPGVMADIIVRAVMMDTADRRFRISHKRVMFQLMIGNASWRFRLRQQGLLFSRVSLRQGCQV